MLFDEIVLILVGLFIGLFMGYLISKIFFLIKMKKLRQESILKSKSVIIGNVKEQLAPLLPDFKYNIKDLVFLGKGVDYVVFDGLSNGELKNIVFLEIKSGQSQQNKNEKMIMRVVDKKLVKYEIFRI